MSPSQNPQNTPSDDPELKGRKVVWKPVLSTPFTYQWPEISDQVGGQILVELLKVLGDLKDPSKSQSCSLSESQHHTRLEQLEGDQTFENPCSLETSLHKTGRLAHIVELRSGKKIEIPDYIPPRRSQSNSKNLKRHPQNSSYIVSGINSVTKALEKEITENRANIAAPRQTKDSKNPSSTLEVGLTEKPYHRRLSFIFVCRNDMNPVSLLDNLLPTVANLNQHLLQCQLCVTEDLAVQPLVLLIPLPKGAENSIAGALDLKRAAVVALRGEDVRMSALSHMAREHVKPISSPSCITSAHKSEGHPSIANKGGVLLLPTHVKHYKTSLPTDMRKHNLERTESRKQHKIAKLERNKNKDS
ncbi:hypothetical protein MJO29_008714 [Puccinia striiformis f. sp. tritici]|uniref:Uncharacterized protein n=1 Tax=Puccinia striiformis f. sp. tritici PST-78 TaxID=1165861 RepID=A0A0L0UV47_9BASI|nr:hypothetical protein Pst134EA_015117 [Puccinia striiformis f. sp. tritici]KAI9603152.1 hypothetical protein H4Q26_002466 [Puccinia striiformis f. sp. tritici PST-130]KNE90624.1 hypothetical protein PSTG_15942 [Puccinia striiformis f. sp. tritici PST-78]KAH9452297.1 hypothetical protein Pst134EB_016253 [Puccinia striiformis f. sp. tritici]KAH9463029.1 hypothetical protein Pst134EA_015117 [Puccinia striiformis f. sp. tritici]KAI7953083.1 hypothetical protein MJO29_008714 [Puccinia striiformis